MTAKHTIIRVGLGLLLAMVYSLIFISLFLFPVSGVVSTLLLLAMTATATFIVVSYIFRVQWYAVAIISSASIIVGSFLTVGAPGFGWLSCFLAIAVVAFASFFVSGIAEVVGD